MSFLFGSSTPQAPAPVQPPTVDDSAAAADAAEKMRKRRGRASTVLSPNDNDTLGANVEQKTLLGS